MTARVRFRQADVTRAAAGMARAGVPVQKIEIDPSGKIVIFPGTPQKEAGSNEWADLE